MPHRSPAQLNERFSIPGHVAFEPIEGGLTAARVRNAHATATVTLHGAHVTAFQPHDEAPVLWMSERSRFETGAAIRGGIPICWPWFGAHPKDPAKPAHGFARIADWELAGTDAPDEGTTRITLRRVDDEATRALWPHAFELTLAVTVAQQLTVELTAVNRTAEPLVCTAALHNYFAVRAVEQVRLVGLAGCRYRDTVPQPPAERVQEGPVTIMAETDRVYTDTEAPCLLEDPGLQRRICVAKEGSRSTVVWNPWVAKSKRMTDFGDEEYHAMLCIETANAASDARRIAPGASHRLATHIRVEKM